MGEIAKAHLHRGRRPRLSFYRERNRTEIDLVLERGAEVVLVEIKSGQTPSGGYFSAFERFEATVAGRESPRVAGKVVVYGGDESQERSAGRLLSWRDLDGYEWV